MDISKPRFVLLPQDREIMQICGIDEKQYKAFMLQCYRSSITKPAEEPTAFLNFLIPIIIGIALSFAAQLLAPKPQEPDQTSEKRKGGQKYVTGQRSAPTSGFDTVQNVVEIGSTIPLVYANRREVGGTYYGGVRVNLNLLFSQLYSVGGGQLLRAIFAVSEGTLPQPAVSQYAIGNNLLNNYDLSISNNSRLSLYYVNGSQSDNRIAVGDHIAGRNPSSDVGNAQNDGGVDVFQTRQGSSWGSDFCFVATPSNQTIFGVSGFIGNNMPFRKNPIFQPVRAYNQSDTNIDPQGLAERLKQNKRYKGRAGVYQIYDTSTQTTYNNENLIRNVDIGDIVNYKIYKESDAKNRHIASTADVDFESYCTDVATSIASRQNSFDDSIILGDKYLIGTAQGVCTFRTSESFESEVVNNPPTGGTSIEARFTITAPGVIQYWDETTLNETKADDTEPPDGAAVTATSHSHIMRMAEGYFAAERASQFIEIGLRSNLNMNFNGICNFRDVARGNYNSDGIRNSRDYNKIDQQRRNNNVFYTSGTMTTPEIRYSFFRLSVREVGTAAYRTIPVFYAIRSMMSTPVYNYISFDLGEEKLWEFKFTPACSYEVMRSDSDSIIALDYKLNTRVYNDYFTSDPIRVYYTGTSVSKNESNLGVITLTTSDGENIGLTDTTSTAGQLFFDQGVYYGEKFARAAEYFMFNEITNSATSPEHEIVYVNCQTSNPTEPKYGNIAMVGLNIRSSKEIQALQQFSVYCNQGIGSTNKFPEVLLDLMTNTRYGTGKILNAAQIDTDSFAAAADWCEDRHYFFDGIIDSKINIRSWATTVAKNFLLDLVIRNGKFALEPVCDFDSPVTVSALFSAGNILEESFEFKYADEADRIPPRVSVKWREERQSTSSVNSTGMFPVVKQVTVRESTTSSDAPLETIDLTDYCTSEKQAIDVGKYTCRVRRLITHFVSFETTPTEAALNIGAIFKLGMETVAYEQPQNGAIASDGTVTSWPPLANGSYDVLLWNGKTNDIKDTTIIITEGTTSEENKNAVFCLKTGTKSAETYKTQALSYTDDGNIRCEATIYPVNDNGLSLITDGWETPGNWSIEGASP